MVAPNKNAFLQVWPNCFVIFLGIIELIVVIILFLTELGNIAANFWTTNVFGGGWLGLIMLIHMITVFVTACCSPGPVSAFRAVIVAFVGIIASVVLLVFDALFVAQPTTCILTPSCITYSTSNITFSYSFRQSFFIVFNGWTAFKSYSETQTKILFQTIQLGLCVLCIIICVIYIVIYYICVNNSKKKIEPCPPTHPSQQRYAGPPPVPQCYYPPPAPQGYYPPPPLPPPPVPQVYYPPPPVFYPPPPGVAPPVFYPPPPGVTPPGFYPPPPQQPIPAPWHPPPPMPQAPPGAIPWNGYRRS